MKEKTDFTTTVLRNRNEAAKQLKVRAKEIRDLGLHLKTAEEPIELFNKKILVPVSVSCHVGNTGIVISINESTYPNVEAYHIAGEEIAGCLSEIEDIVLQKMEEINIVYSQKVKQILKGE